MFSLNREGLCRKGAACVRDRRARRVEGFFKRHPQLANDYLDHSYFEVRAVAAKYASLLRLQALLTDPEPEVRAMAAARLPASRLGALARDPEPRVRIVLANRLEGAALLAMLDDPDYLVRVNVVRRLDPDLLPLAVGDADSEVRGWVARRLPPERLGLLMFDPEPLVRLVVAERLPEERLGALREDEDSPRALHGGRTRANGFVAGSPERQGRTGARRSPKPGFRHRKPVADAGSRARRSQFKSTRPRTTIRRVYTAVAR